MMNTLLISTLRRLACKFSSKVVASLSSTVPQRREKWTVVANVGQLEQRRMLSAALYDGTYSGPAVVHASYQGQPIGDFNFTATSTMSAGVVSLNVDQGDLGGTPGTFFHGTGTVSAKGVVSGVVTVPSPNLAGVEFTMTFRGKVLLGHPTTGTGTIVVTSPDGISGTGTWSTARENHAPTDIAIAGQTIKENSRKNSLVGTFSTTDPDVGDKSTYVLLDNAGGRFKLVGNALKVTNGNLLDFETNSTHNVDVQVTDKDGLSFHKVITITVTNDNEKPTNVILSNTSVAKNQPVSTIVGQLSATDPDVGDTFTYSLLNTSSGRFKLVGGQIQTDKVLPAGSYVIQLKVTDAGGLTFTKKFIIIAS